MQKCHELSQMLKKCPDRTTLRRHLFTFATWTKNRHSGRRCPARRPSSCRSSGRRRPVRLFRHAPFQGKMASSPRPGYGPPNIKISPACCPADGARPFFKLGGKRSVLPRQRPYCITFTGTSGARRTIPSMMTCSPALSSPSTTLMSPDSKRMFTLR